MGLPVADVDLATDARPDAVLALAASCGIRAIPTGVEHGTVTLVAGGQPFEVTSFRRDVETFGRRAVVAYSDDIAEDAARRDFTMNALYVTPEGEVADPLGGLEDLRGGRVRFVGDAGQRIREDYLRILRFFRFFAWYGHVEDGLDPAGLAACAAERDGLAQLSRERVGGEIIRLLAAPDPGPALAAMARAGVLERVLPGADATALAPLIAAEAAAHAEPRWQRRLAALGWRPGWADLLRLSRADRKALEAATAARTAGESPGAAAYRHGADAARDAVLIEAAARGRPVVHDLPEALARGTAAEFPVAAADIDLSGPALGAALRELEDAWIASDFALDREALLARL
jgi:poly(A) polymerase